MKKLLKKLGDRIGRIQPSPDMNALATVICLGVLGPLFVLFSNKWVWLAIAIVIIVILL